MRTRGDVQLAQARQARQALLNQLSGYNFTIAAGSDWFIPAIALSVDQSALNHLFALPNIEGISPDDYETNNDGPAYNQIGASFMWNQSPLPQVFGNDGYTGAGEAIVVIDSGIETSHPYFHFNSIISNVDGPQSRVDVAHGACVSGAGGTTILTTSLCPGGRLQIIGGGTEPCSQTGCDHGTEVAGVAAGHAYHAAIFAGNGIAYQATIVPVMAASSQVGLAEPSFSDFDLITSLQLVANFPYYYPSEHVVVVNMSIGGHSTQLNCDHQNDAMTMAINNLANLGITVVVSTGNGSSLTGISFPACISTVISVGSVNKSDLIARSSNRGPNTTIFAPGDPVITSENGGTTIDNQYIIVGGTSFAAPQVSGAIALLQQEAGNSLSVAQIKSILLSTGEVIGKDINQNKRIRLDVGQAGLVALQRTDTIGVYRGNTFLLRNSLSSGYADTAINFGTGTDAYPVVGDWSGRVLDTRMGVYSQFNTQLGVYNRNSAIFTLCLNNPSPDLCAGSSATVIQFGFGSPGNFPLSGYWSPRPQAYGISTDPIGPGAVQTTIYANTGVGVFNPGNGLVALKNQLSSGYADYTIQIGLPGDTPVAGDWGNNGHTGVGVYRPNNSTFYLINAVTNATPALDLSFTYGAGALNDFPVIGNWQGYDAPSLGVGVYRTSGTGIFLLRNALSSGFNNNAVTFGQGLPLDIPVVGHWTTTSALPVPFRTSPAQPVSPSVLIAPTFMPSQSGSVPSGNQIGG